MSQVANSSWRVGCRPILFFIYFIGNLLEEALYFIGQIGEEIGGVDYFCPKLSCTCWLVFLFHGHVDQVACCRLIKIPDKILLNEMHRSIGY